MTISGNASTLIPPEHPIIYPCQTTPIISSVKRAFVIRSYTDKKILNVLKEKSNEAECGGSSCAAKQTSLEKAKGKRRRVLNNVFFDGDDASGHRGECRIGNQRRLIL